MPQNNMAHCSFYFSGHRLPLCPASCLSVTWPLWVLNLARVVLFLFTWGDRRSYFWGISIQYECLGLDSVAHTHVANAIWYSLGYPGFSWVSQCDTGPAGDLCLSGGNWRQDPYWYWMVTSWQRISMLYLCKRVKTLKEDCSYLFNTAGS